MNLISTLSSIFSYILNTREIINEVEMEAGSSMEEEKVKMYVKN